MFRNGQLCVYELMDEDSAVRYWEGYAKIAFDAGVWKCLVSMCPCQPADPRTGQRSLYTSCTLKIPSSLVVPDLSLPGPLIPPVSGTTGFPVAHDTASDHSAAVETFREIKCCFSVTIRRDA
jgi:hypothetical protein